MVSVDDRATVRTVAVARRRPRTSVRAAMSNSTGCNYISLAAQRAVWPPTFSTFGMVLLPRFTGCQGLQEDAKAC